MRTFTNISDASSEAAESEKSSESAQTRCTSYEKGAVLTLRANSLGNRLLTVQVLRIYRPCSLACVMAVEILHGLSISDNIPPRAVLKLFDRRFAQKLRKEHKIDTWTPNHEDTFIEYVNSGEAVKFANTLQQSDYLEEPESGWNAAQSETYLQEWCSGMCATELEVYGHLRALQGRHIPKLFTPVEMLVQPPHAGTVSYESASTPLLQVHGFLMEHIIGHTLVQMPDFIRAKHWQSIFDDALKIIHLLSDLGVLNENVNPANFIASPMASDNGNFRVAMVDFAQCSLRQSSQSDADWRKLKADQDEEGTLSGIISGILKKVGFELRHAPSNRFLDSCPCG